jgi:hypothetical protein
MKKQCTFFACFFQKGLPFIATFAENSSTLLYSLYYIVFLTILDLTGQTHAEALLIQRAVQQQKVS